MNLSLGGKKREALSYKGGVVADEQLHARGRCYGDCLVYALRCVSH